MVLFYDKILSFYFILSIYLITDVNMENKFRIKLKLNSFDLSVNLLYSFPLQFDLVPDLEHYYRNFD